MNFLVLAAPYYEYQAATIVQGLQTLGHKVYGFNGDKRNYMAPHSGEIIDVFIDLFPQGKPMDVFPDVPRIMVWPYDEDDGPRPLLYNAYDGYDLFFVRDYLGDGPANVYPMNYGIEDRYYCVTDTELKPFKERVYDFIFMGSLQGSGFMKDRHKRMAKIQRQFKDRKFIVSDCTGRTGDPDNYWSMWVNGRFRHNKDYFRELNNSRLILSPRGGGPECGRHYEAFASGGIPIIQYSETRKIPPLWEEEFPEMIWRSGDQLHRCVTYFLSDLDRAEEYAKRVFEFGKEHLRTSNRAQFIVDKIKEHKLV